MRRQSPLTRLRRTVTALTGRSGQQLQQALLAQLAAAEAGARLARALMAGEVSAPEAREQIQRLEHDGDERRGELIELLNASLVTPIDREDLFRLSRSIDDVLDMLRDTVREADLFTAGDLGEFAVLLDLVTSGVQALTAAVADIGSSSERLAHRALEAKKAGGAVRRAYQYEIARLLTGDVTVATLQRREIARRIDMAGTRLSDAADDLADGAMKRWR